MKIRTLAAAALAASLSACSSEFSGINIYETCAPPLPDQTTGQCLYTATCAATLASTPTLDVTTAQLDFRLPIQVNNDLVDNSSPTDGRINTNNATVQSWEITYTGAALAGVNLATFVRVPTTGSASELIHLIPVAYFGALAPAGSGTTTIVVNVRGHGKLDSQDSFTTAWAKIPVQVCAGCLAGDFCPGSIMASCPSAAAGATSPGQTATVTCITPP